MIYGSNLHRIIELILRRIADGEKISDINIEQLIHQSWSNPPNINPEIVISNQKTAFRSE